MKLEKAIEILSDEPETIDFESDTFALDALKLVTEAAKLVQRERLLGINPVETSLPGETKD